MRKAIRFFAMLSLLLGCIACAEETFLRIPLGGAIQELKPNYEQGKRFVSNNGDTLTLRRISQSNFWEKQTENIPNAGSFSDYDYLLLERQNLTIGSDTPYFRFSFNLEASYAPNNSRLGTDAYRLEFEEEFVETLQLNLSFIDSLECESKRCNFTDTLKIIDRTFLNCFFTPRDSVSLQALYINSANGLVGFKSIENEIFELID